MTRRLLIAGIGLIVALGALAVGGWWLLIREDAQPATRPPDIPQELLQTPSGSSGGDQAANNVDVLIFRIIPDLSEAAYFVNERLASLPVPSTAKGTTKEIEGEFYLTTDGTALAPDRVSSFRVDLRNLTSDESRRDQRVQQALETSRYPYASFTVSSVSGYNPSIPQDQEQSLQLTGILDLHGVQREVTWDLKVRRQGNVISGLATLTVSFADFNITPPTFAGLISIDDKATLQVQVIAEAK